MITVRPYSFSRLHLFEDCKYAYYLNYVLVDEERCIYTKVDNFYGLFGSFCHLILQKTLDGEIKPSKTADYYVKHYDEYVDTTGVNHKTALEYYYLGLSYFQDEEFDWLDRFEIIGVEKKVEFKIGKDDFIGYIDLLLRDKETGELVIIDHKSAAYPLGKNGKVLKTKESSHLSYKRQLYLYAEAIRQAYGVFPTILSWNYFKEQNLLSIPFDKNEYKEAIGWTEKTLKDIKDEENYPANKQFFYCHNLCDFRESCEYLKCGDDDGLI